MSNLITKTTELAMDITLNYVKEGDVVVDATCGTGQDTVALAKAVGEKGIVHAFDIQERALELTADRLRTHGIEVDASTVQLHHDSFIHMGDYIPEGSASAVLFNLGYLPGADKTITTTADTTITGLTAALRAIRPGGILTVVLYDGHAAGVEEKRRVRAFAESLDSSVYHAAYVSFLNQPNHPPEILWITRKR